MALSKSLSSELSDTASRFGHFWDVFGLPAALVVVFFGLLWLPLVTLLFARMVDRFRNRVIISQAAGVASSSSESVELEFMASDTSELGDFRSVSLSLPLPLLLPLGLPLSLPRPLFLGASADSDV